MNEHVSQREFAKLIGRSHVWVNRLVKEGRLPADKRGRIPLKDGLEAYEASNTVGHDGAREVQEAKRRELAKKYLPSSGEPPELSEPGELVDVKSVNEAYNRARTAEKTYQAKLRELEYKEASGELIPVGDVKSDAQRAASEVRERLMAMPPRVAGLCEGKPAREIERLITEGINEALEALQSSRFGKGK